MATMVGDYLVEQRSPASLGIPSWHTSMPYTQDDYRNDMRAAQLTGAFAQRPGGSPADILQAFANAGFSQNDPALASAMRSQNYDPKLYLPQPAATATGQQAGQQAGGVGQYNTGIPTYGPAPFGAAINMVNPGWLGTSQAGKQQAGQAAGDLLRQMQQSGAVDLIQQANLQNTQQSLAHQMANSQAGLQMGGLGLGAYRNLLQAMAPYDQFAASMGSMPIRATGGLLNSLIGGL